MKAILEFNMPEDTAEHKLAINGSNYLFALQDFDNYLRNELKYNPELSKSKSKMLEEIREKLHEILNGRDIDLYE